MFLRLIYGTLREGNGTPTPVLLPGKSHGWRILVGYSPWGLKELDTTEQVHIIDIDLRIHLFSTKSDIKEICKNVK